MHMLQYDQTKIVFDHVKYVNICKVVYHLRSEVSVRLTQIHAITGCDTTSFLHNVGKVIKDPSSLSLLEGIGKSKLLEPSAVKSAIKFVQINCYNGKEKERYAETRVRLYKSIKNKSSLSLPPDQIL